MFTNNTRNDEDISLHEPICNTHTYIHNHQSCHNINDGRYGTNWRDRCNHFCINSYSNYQPKLLDMDKLGPVASQGPWLVASLVDALVASLVASQGPWLVALQVHELVV